VRADNTAGGIGGAQREPIISVRNVVKRFDGRAVLDGINLDIMPGETMIIMGGSGSGKSTLLRTIIGSFAADEGSVMMFGKNMCSMQEAGLNEVRKRFGILFQSGALFNSMTLAENVALILQEHTDLGAEIIDIQVKIKLEMVGLLEAANRYPSEVSGGMKKRAGLARALALDPEILFYDEPSAGLDPVTSSEIDQLIINLSKQLGVTSVVVTHEMDSAFTIADRICMLDKGKMIAVETREWFDAMRKLPEDEAQTRPVRERLIRQFLRGDAQGPLTERKNTGNYERALFGESGPVLLPTPSIEPTRRR
jgi:phospholipid/cholesterol/gamma-HCH transport system ATP-binding protein